MIHLQNNETLPDEYLKLVKLSSPSDHAFIVSTNPMMVFIILENIENKEKEAFKSEMTIGSASIKGVPFVVIDFGSGFSFDMPLKSMEADMHTLNVIHEEIYPIYSTDDILKECVTQKLLGVKKTSARDS